VHTEKEEGNRAIQRDRLINNSNLFLYFLCYIFFLTPSQLLFQGIQTKICIFIFFVAKVMRFTFSF